MNDKTVVGYFEVMNITQQQRLFDALKEISHYDSPERIKRHSERQYGLAGDEAIEMAYENVIQTAKSALRGVRRPNEPK